jgi:hypothetical protein
MTWFAAVISPGRDGEFFYDAALPNGKTIHQADLDALTNHARDIAKVRAPPLADENDARVLQSHWPHILCKPGHLLRGFSCSHCMARRDGSLVFDICGKKPKRAGKIRRDLVNRTCCSNSCGPKKT